MVLFSLGGLLWNLRKAYLQFSVLQHYIFSICLGSTLTLFAKSTINASPLAKHSWISWWGRKEEWELKKTTKIHFCSSLVQHWVKTGCCSHFHLKLCWINQQCQVCVKSGWQLLPMHRIRLLLWSSFFLYIFSQRMHHNRRHTQSRRMAQVIW